MTNEINKLKREAEIYNNPQSYVKYAKLERQITKLQRQLEDIVSTKPVQENDNISKVAYLKVGMQLVFYVINVIFIYSFKDKQLNIKGDVLNNNIVFDYFNKDGFTSIPFYMILVMGGMFISNILDNLEKIKKIIA